MAYDWLPYLLAQLVGIDAYEVRQVLEEGRRRPKPAVEDGMRFLGMWGRTRAGRPLIVTLRPTPVAHDWTIVWARDMTAEELAEFEAWEAS